MSELKRPNIEDYDMTTDYEQYFADFDAYMEADRLQKFEKALNEMYDIDAEEWSNTPESVKKVLMGLHEDAEKHNWIMEELECWKDNMPI
tara:strand:+ start:100 stop:369 length:270 start_codon:yes stop_codon:yes gene_type:complete